MLLDIFHKCIEKGVMVKSEKLPLRKACTLLLCQVYAVNPRMFADQLLTLPFDAQADIRAALLTQVPNLQLERSTPQGKAILHEVIGFFF